MIKGYQNVRSPKHTTCSELTANCTPVKLSTILNALQSCKVPQSAEMGNEYTHVH